jgi:hypothetical protein
VRAKHTTSRASPSTGSLTASLIKLVSERRTSTICC